MKLLLTLTLALTLCTTLLHAQNITTTLNALAESGTIQGAQVAVSRGDKLLLSHTTGHKAIDSTDPVTTDTLFLIASCSKPFASATVLRMLQAGEPYFKLTDNIDRWLPAYATAKIDGGTQAARAPTIAELLCHRAGIYSQKVSITRAQSQLLYTFDNTLEDGVTQIAAHPLLAQPGTRYAYSGAGYCVLGRVAELIADDQPFESLLQKNVCAPLNLTRTTYFPSTKFKNFATGFAAKKAPHNLGAKHLWPLIGGSLYTTAEEMVTFAQAIAGHIQTTDNHPFLTEDSWKELNTVRSPRQKSSISIGANPGKGYTLGWSTLRQNGRTIRLSHSGSLQSYRSHIALDRSTGICVAATWTLPHPSKETEAGQKITTALKLTLDD